MGLIDAHAQLAQRLVTVPVFRHMSASELAQVCQNSELRLVKEGQSILDEDTPPDRIFLLLSGLLGAFYNDPLGKSTLVRLFGAPSYFAEIENFLQIPYLVHVEALYPSEVMCIRGDALTAVLQTNAAACYDALKDTSARFYMTEAHERTLSFEKVEIQLACLLWSFVSACGEQHPRGMMLPLRPTNEALGRWLGIATRSVERAVQSLMQEGMLERCHGRLVVTSMEDLERKVPHFFMGLFSRMGEHPKNVRQTPPIVGEPRRAFS